MNTAIIIFHKASVKGFKFYDMHIIILLAEFPIAIRNTHEAIIDQDTYDNCQRMRENIRRYPDGWGEAHPLGGLLFCADCGSKMYVHRTNNGKRIPQFTCSAYGKVPVGSLCPTQHRVVADVVLTLIKESLKAIIQFSQEDEAEFARVVKEVIASQQTNDEQEQRARLSVCRRPMRTTSTTSVWPWIRPLRPRPRRK